MLVATRYYTRQGKKSREKQVNSSFQQKELIALSKNRIIYAWDKYAY